MSLEANFMGFTLESFRFMDRIMMFWTNMIISPSPNSTADKIKKKKVRERRFILSYARPMNNVSIYKVIHKISAVSSR